MTSLTDMANPWVVNLPTYEPGKPIEEVAREMGFENPESIAKMASNENALGPSPLAIKAMQGAATAMHRYPDGSAHYLRQGLADRLGVRPNQILPGNGSNELLELLGHVFLGPGKGIVISGQAFLIYQIIAASHQAPVRIVPPREYTHDLDGFMEAIESETKLVFIGNPNNPTGTMVDGAMIEAFMDRIPENILVCFDEAYIEFVPEESRPDTIRYIREGRPVVVLRTFSKIYGLAGLRIGYAIGSEECIGLMNKVRQPFNVNAMALAAAVAAMDDIEHLENSRALVNEGRRYLERQCAELKLPVVRSVANFMLVDVSRVVRGDLRCGRTVFTELQKRGVIVRPMDGYGLPGFVRVTIGTPGENEKFILALENIITENQRGEVAP